MRLQPESLPVLGVFDPKVGTGKVDVAGRLQGRDGFSVLKGFRKRAGRRERCNGLRVHIAARGVVLLATAQCVGNPLRCGVRPVLEARCHVRRKHIGQQPVTKGPGAGTSVQHRPEKCGFGVGRAHGCVKRRASIFATSMSPRHYTGCLARSARSSVAGQRRVGCVCVESGVDYRGGILASSS